MLLFLAACSPTTALTIQQLDHYQLPGSDQILQPASYASWSADPDRLIDDIPRAIKQSHWGLLNIHVQDPSSPNDQTSSDNHNQTPRWIRATALLPDGRQAAITATFTQQTSDANTPGGNHAAQPTSTIAVAIRVGHFGDPKIQQNFLRTLAKILAGPPKIKRGGSFQLP